ncbi:hypothetical protein APED_33050 [Acanthopleuribacter pedis]
MAKSGRSPDRAKRRPAWLDRARLQRLEATFTLGMLSHWQRVERRRIRQTVRAFLNWVVDNALPLDDGDGWSVAREMCRFLTRELRRRRQLVQQYHQDYQAFQNRNSRAASRSERRDYLLTFARQLGARGWRLIGDRRALRRHLDADALADRYMLRVREQERAMVFCLERYGVLAAAVLAKAPDKADALWAQLEIEGSCRELWDYAGNPMLRKEAFTALTRSLAVLSPAQIDRVVSDQTVHAVYRASMEKREQVWYHLEAIKLLARLAPDSFDKVLVRWFDENEAGDAIFFRARTAKLWGELLPDRPELSERAMVIAGDRSPHVRQAFAEAVCGGEPEFARMWLAQLACCDPSEPVRAAALLQMGRNANKLGLASVCDLVEEALLNNDDPFVLRVACQVARMLATAHREADRPAFYQRLCGWFAGLRTRLGDACPDQVDRELSQTLEHVWLQQEQGYQADVALLRARLRLTRPGRTAVLPPGLRRLEPAVLGRVLAVLAMEGFGLDVEVGRRVRRGPVFGFRWWRFLHELRHPDPAKRTTTSHLVGRVTPSLLRAPSPLLGELAPANVPGEPLVNGREGGWRPFLPLVDDVLSLLDGHLFRRAMRFYTSEGVTVVTAPRGFWRRLRAFATLTRRFPHYAGLRNSVGDGGTSEAAYVVSLRKLGFEVSLEATDPQRPVRPGVAKYFQLPAPVLEPGLFRRLQDYLVSVYGNTLHELIVFLVLASAAFLTRHCYNNGRIRWARRRLPLVIGGWGTRGKSGTERLKAALFSAMGFSVFSKTTGCEAMFVYGAPFEKLLEMPLFRPFDKASIWEQGDVVRLAAGFGCEVFLWECMALRDTYVSILQRQWMRDDFATITNTYPDHEDIQGPAGYNIPRVMTEFIPKKATLFTSEESMLPILEDAAGRLGTDLHAVGWLEAGLLTPDVLARFPYEEHPYNIALVLAMAAHLGIERDFALREMADHVVPDLGVLKTFAPAPIQGRRLVFANGMSANERHGCLSNWRRLGWLEVSLDDHPDTLIGGVVNNRADRISRSQIFAGLMVKDLAVDRLFLIGSNLAGLQGYLADSWAAFAEDLRLVGTARTPRERFAGVALRLRIPHTEQQVRARLACMLAAVLPESTDDAQRAALAAHWAQPTALAEALAALDDVAVDWVDRFYAPLLDQYQRYQKLLAAAEAGDEAWESAAKKQLEQWFFAKIVVIEDFYATGDQIIQTIIDHTPPGMTHRVMGLQNIKGTGLDFVYRFQDWAKTHDAVVQLTDGDVDAFGEGLKHLLTKRGYGLLEIEQAAAGIEAAKHRSIAQNERFQAQLAVIETRFRQARADLARRLQVTVQQEALLPRLVHAIETFVDLGDAVRRRKQAHALYRDLVNGRISRAAALNELAELNRRQKGGWLWKRLTALRKGRGGGGDDAV